MITKTMYESFDGNTFESEEACLRHENTLNDDQIVKSITQMPSSIYFPGIGSLLQIRVPDCTFKHVYKYFIQKNGYMHLFHYHVGYDSLADDFIEDTSENTHMTAGNYFIDVIDRGDYDDMYIIYTIDSLKQFSDAIIKKIENITKE